MSPAVKRERELNAINERGDLSQTERGLLHLYYSLFGSAPGVTTGVPPANRPTAPAYAWYDPAAKSIHLRSDTLEQNRRTGFRLAHELGHDMQARVPSRLRQSPPGYMRDYDYESEASTAAHILLNLMGRSRPDYRIADYWSEGFVPDGKATFDEAAMTDKYRNLRSVIDSVLMRDTTRHISDGEVMQYSIIDQLLSR